MIKVIIWNKEPLMGFEMSLWQHSHTYMYTYVLQLFTELIVLPKNAIALNAMTFSGL
jgi:hypothetical protein